MKLDGKNIICVCMWIFYDNLNELWAFLIYVFLYTPNLLQNWTFVKKTHIQT